MARVGIDARRQRDNGVARVTRLLVDSLARSPHQLVLFGPADTLKHQFPWAECVEYAAPILSAEHLLGFNEVLTRHDVDVFISPQFYNSPWTGCPQVRLLHDTFPLDPGARHAEREAIVATYGRRHVEDVTRIVTGAEYSTIKDFPRAVFRAFYDQSIRAASRILTVSEQSRASLARLYPSAVRKIRVLPLYCDESLTSNTSTSPLVRGIDVLSVSKFEPRKNQLSLLEAGRQIWHESSSFRMTLVGSPSAQYPEYTNSVLKLAQAGTSEGWLTHAEGVSDAELAKLYADAKIVCVPSIQEGFGLPALEAMSHGCALVATHGTAVTEVCGEAAALTRGDAGSLREGLTRLRNSPQELVQRSVLSRTRASAFPIDATTEVLCAAIMAALTEHHPSG